MRCKRGWRKVTPPGFCHDPVPYGRLGGENNGRRSGKSSTHDQVGSQNLTGRPLISDPCKRSRALSAARMSNCKTGFSYSPCPKHRSRPTYVTKTMPRFAMRSKKVLISPCSSNILRTSSLWVSYCADYEIADQPHCERTT